MTTQDLYNSILNSRWYIAEHATILNQFDENEDPLVKKQRERTMNVILNTKLLENHYTQILQKSDGDTSALIDSVTFLSVEEIILLVSRNQELCELPIKN